MLTSALMTTTTGGLPSTFRSPGWGLWMVSHQPAPAPVPRSMEGGYIQIVREDNNVHDQKGNGLLKLNSPCEQIRHLLNLIIQMSNGRMHDSQSGHHKFTGTGADTCSFTRFRFHSHFNELEYI